MITIKARPWKFVCGAGGLGADIARNGDTLSRPPYRLSLPDWGRRIRARPLAHPRSYLMNRIYCWISSDSQAGSERLASNRMARQCARMATFSSVQRPRPSR